MTLVLEHTQDQPDQKDQKNPKPNKFDLALLAGIRELGPSVSRHLGDSAVQRLIKHLDAVLEYPTTEKQVIESLKRLVAFGYAKVDKRGPIDDPRIFTVQALAGPAAVVQRPVKNGRKSRRRREESITSVVAELMRSNAAPRHTHHRREQLHPTRMVA
jgi:hypothetical protein